MTSNALIVIAMLAGSAAFTGAVAYALSGRDLQGWGRVAAALISAALVGLTSLFIPYLPVLAFLATAAAYPVLRRVLRPGLAIAASAAVLFGGLTCAVLIMVAALNQM